MESIIKISDNAATRIRTLLTTEVDKKALRISVEGGGCAGFSYKFDLVSTCSDEDIVFEQNQAKIYIDKISLTYLVGSEIDFVDDIISKSFQIKNPNAVSGCGCGTSFSI
ncbi:putative iron binding protein from the HesB_IscA_SufA family [Liberibacter crescens BT-1]|uniref:Putative iron binding protein from the HesB_IscA_SufA family n=1 Tax=Liberibacter crescens (strain BT-1) TaxID=1215343 RepID=L0EVH1_LIBCB|nr:iron-sulfur cluster assembly accessory protein [Liberibacter crescens]AGA64957.1 putative iron binding protein from the HesB_IscA_SufA family [Liberibacter crescens BT-1]AMC12978.1 heme biosynthesis protein HemY [Liberibacter crescens]